MTILSVAYPLLPVGPDSGGGAEQILYLLERGLVNAGHRSIVIAAAGSQISGELIVSSAVTGAFTDEVRESAQLAHRLAIDKALAQYSIDLIHFHGLDFHTYLPDHRVAKLATLHLPLDWYPQCIFENADLHLNCVSQTQANSQPAGSRLSVVGNGVDLNSYRPTQTEKRSLLWLGRICPEKAVHIALDVSRRLDLPMIIAGPVHPFRDHEKYFAETIKPLLGSERQYIGPVGLDQKIALLAEASCLLIPSLVPETSSLVTMEAFASGTPAVAWRSGALPEIVEHERTGFIVDSENRMMEAVKRIGKISPAACRHAAETRFDSERMIRNYFDLYQTIVA